MNGIPVIVTAATEAGRLYPRYENGVGILIFESRPPRPWPHGVNIDGTVILDFDEDRILAGVELVASMRTWKGKGATAQPPGQPGDIRLGHGLAGSVGYDWPV